MSPDPMVTVLTAVRNGRRHLSETVASIRAQTFGDFEHIIVDDASDDGTPELVEQLAREDDRVRLIRRATSGGPYAAANEGLRSARGTYVARIDGDDVAPADRLAIQAGYLAAHGDARACVGAWRLMATDGAIEDRVRPVPSASVSVLRWRLCLRVGIVHSTLMMRRDAFTELGGYTERPVSQDYRMWCELTRRGWLAVLPDVLVHWRQHEGQIGSKRRDEQLAENINILDDHLRAIDPPGWARDDIDALNRVGRSMPLGVARGVDILARWQRGWRRDQTLTSADRRELRTLGLELGLKHVRANGKPAPARAALALARIAALYARALV